MTCSMMLPWTWMPLEVRIGNGNSYFVHCFVSVYWGDKVFVDFCHKLVFADGIYLIS